MTIGAQVSYRDLAGFGRRDMDVRSDELGRRGALPAGALDGIARATGGRVSYVKPHGALYNAAVDHEAQAAAVVDAVVDYDPALPVLTLPGSAVLGRGRAGRPATVAEAFADRAYTSEGALVPRRSPGAVLHDPPRSPPGPCAWRPSGWSPPWTAPVPVDARSICVHGDTPGAVLLAQSVRDGLVKAGVTLKAFT